MAETDIASCFEAIGHDRLVEAVEERICDRAVIKCLRAMLRAGVMDNAGHPELIPHVRCIMQWPTPTASSRSPCRRATYKPADASS